MHELKATCVLFFFFSFLGVTVATDSAMEMKRLNKKVKNYKIPFGERNIQAITSRSYEVRWACALVQVEQI